MVHKYAYKTYVCFCVDRKMNIPHILFPLNAQWAIFQYANWGKEKFYISISKHKQRNLSPNFEANFCSSTSFFQILTTGLKFNTFTTRIQDLPFIHICDAAHRWHNHSCPSTKNFISIKQFIQCHWSFLNLHVTKRALGSEVIQELIHVYWLLQKQNVMTTENGLMHCFGKES